LVHFVSRTSSLRVPLWILTLLLTTIILSFPAQLRLEYSPIQSIQALPLLALFGITYYLWLLLLLLLLFSRPKDSSLEKGVLVVLFALVFLGFWFTRATYTAIRYDGVGNAAHVRFLLQDAEGPIPVDNTNLFYFNFPGMHFLVEMSARIGGLSALHAVSVTLVSHLLIFGLLLYGFFRRNFGSSTWATLGSMLVVQGNIMLPRYSFYSGIWALNLLLTILLLIHSEHMTETRSGMAALGLLMGATTVTHLTTSFLIFFLLVSSYLVRQFLLVQEQKGPELVNIPIIALSLTMPLAWGLFHGSKFFESVIQIIYGWIRDLPQSVLVYPLTFGRVYGGAAAPLWATVVRYSWILIVFVVGTLLGLRDLLILRTLDTHRRKDISGLVGVLALTVLFSFLSPGSGEFYRFFLYGAFFTVPVLLKHLITDLGRTRHVGIGTLVAFFFVLSLPTFLAHNNQVGLSAYYPQELEAGRFLEKIVGGRGRGLSVHSDPAEFGLLAYSIPFARFLLTPEAPFLEDREGLGRALRKSILSFRHTIPAPRGDLPLFYLSERRKMLAQHLLQVDQRDAIWSEAEKTLNEEAVVYDNHAVKLFMLPQR
jgi:cytochrome b